MNKYLLLLAALVKLSSPIDSYDLIDEAKSQLEDLEVLVTSRILIAHNDLDTHSIELLAHSNAVLEDGNIAIDQVHADVSAQLVQIKELAGNRDISRCTSGREQMINRLPNELKERLRVCITDSNEMAASFLDDQKYIVDVVINQVHRLEFQLNQCGNSILCISPLVSQIEQYMVQLPQMIEEEVNKAADQVDEIRVLVDGCHTLHVSDFTGYVTDLIEQIAACVNGIIG